MAGQSSTKPGRRQRQKAERLERIKAAARALFREHGYDATTMRAIAARADLGLGTLYSYVTDKHGLLDLISEHELSLVAEQAFSCLPRRAGPRVQLGHVYRAIFQHHASDEETARLLFRELTFGRQDIGRERAGRFLEFIRRSSRIVERAQGRQLRSDIDAMEAALAIFGLHFFYATLWLSGSAGLNAESAFDRFSAALDLTFDGLKAKPRRGAR